MRVAKARIVLSFLVVAVALGGLESRSEAPLAAELPVPAAFDGVSIGPEVTDGEGRKGRLHRVVSGDTLWDISEAYLGTAWVWPSVWVENAEIANPHRIYPGDTIWISRTEMRILRGDEVEDMWRRVREAAARSGSIARSEPTATAETDAANSVAVSPGAGLGFVSEGDLVAASSIVGSPEVRTWLAGRDQVYIGLGVGQVRAGERFTIFRDPVPVFDFESRKKIGYHVLVVGWLEVTDASGSSSIAEIRQSTSEVARGDRLMRRRERPPRVELREAPAAAVAGRIVFTSNMRRVVGTRDTVYLNRGQEHGLEEGVRLEVYDEGSMTRDRVRSASVRTPDHVVAELVVINARPESSVAVVTGTRRELQVGDHFRTSPDRKLAGL